MKSTAILVDGGFFIKRFRAIYGADALVAPEVAQFLWDMCIRHLYQGPEKHDLYRILYYDCLPYDQKTHHPITKKFIDFGSSPVSKFRLELFEELKKKRKVALRLGQLEGGKNWVINPRTTKELLSGKRKADEIKPGQVTLDLTQKRVDIKIGLDIASMTIKKQVDQIILVSGDSDFVPAAKMARREGIDFILDPMYNKIKPHLHEHIDGLQSHCDRPKNYQEEDPSASTSKNTK